MKEVDLKKQDGKTLVYITKTFNIGELNEEERTENVYSVPIGIQFSKQLAFEQLKRDFKNGEDEDKIKENLEDYCKYWLLDVLGVKHFPIKENEDGTLDGIVIDAMTRINK